MQTFILVSLILASMAIPAWAAGDRSARRGLKRTLLLVAGLSGAYLLVLIFFYARHFIPEWSP